MESLAIAQTTIQCRFLFGTLMTVSDKVLDKIAEELCFDVNGLKISAKRWNRGAKHQAIALHGWLDNCCSFDLMAEDLCDIDLIALDSAGHGKSDFRSADSQYLIWSEVSEVFTIAKQLGWEQFNLIGHSRGAGITAIYAGTFPQQILSLILIEGGIALPMPAMEAPENLAAHIALDLKLSGTKGTLFPSKQDAIAARANGFTKISEASASTLATRSLVQDEDGFRWHADARLKAPSSFKLTHEQIDAFLSKIRCPVLLIEADKGILKKMPFFERHLGNIRKLSRQMLPGGHHLHMEESAQACAKTVCRFIEDAD